MGESNTFTHILPFYFKSFESGLLISQQPKFNVRIMNNFGHFHKFYSLPLYTKIRQDFINPHFSPVDFPIYFIIATSELAVFWWIASILCIFAFLFFQDGF